MSSIKQILVAALGLTIAGMAQARDSDAYYAYAEVLRVDPVIVNGSQPVNREVCRDVAVDYYRPGYTYHRDRTGSTIAGAIVGGALGSLVGRGDGRRAATVAGALIGGSIAHDHARHGYYTTDGYYERGYQRRCRTETEYENDDQVSGYDITYRYHDETYQQRLEYDPGDRVRVSVDGDDVQIVD